MNSAKPCDVTLISLISPRQSVSSFIPARDWLIIRTFRKEIPIFFRNKPWIMKTSFSGWNLWLLFESSRWTFCAREIYCSRKCFEWFCSTLMTSSSNLKIWQQIQDYIISGRTSCSLFLFRNVCGSRNHRTL